MGGDLKTDYNCAVRLGVHCSKITVLFNVTGCGGLILRRGIPL